MDLNIAARTSEFGIRFAVPEDTSVILSFIKGLAEYERMLDEVIAPEALLREWIFEKQKAEVLIGELKGGQPIAFALFFHNFSTFNGRAGIYLEDLYVLPAYRQKGFGKDMLRALARITVDRGCCRLEWSCLDWNESSLAFYKSLGAVPMNEWTTHRLTGDTLFSLAK